MTHAWALAVDTTSKFVKTLSFYGVECGWFTIKRGVQLKCIKGGILIIDKFHVDDYLVFWIIKDMVQGMQFLLRLRLILSSCGIVLGVYP